MSTITITDTAAAGSYQNAAPVTPDDDHDLPVPAQALYVGAPGDLRVTTVNGQTVTLPELQPGMYAIAVRRVWATIPVPASAQPAGEIVAWW
jgi:hypothetical protein